MPESVLRLIDVCDLARLSGSLVRAQVGEPENQALSADSDNTQRPQILVPLQYRCSITTGTLMTGALPVVNR